MNEFESTYPRDACVHDLVAEWAARTPDAVALVWNEACLTYRELDARAARLAGALRRRGAGPEMRVAVVMERSLDLVVTLLAVLKAGGVFVPFEPSTPPERLASLLAEAGAAMVLEAGWEEGLGDGVARGGAAAADNLAYVMFTSGTTGRPKGVAVPHRGIVRLVRGTNFARLDAGETFLLLAPVSFDASTLEIWGALANGARLVIYSWQGGLALEELGEVIARHRVSTLWLTAGLFHQMVENNLQGLRGVRQLLAGGDVLSPRHVRQALAALPGCTVINGYGPTENTTFTCCNPMSDAAEVDESQSIPIGWPVARTRAVVEDGELLAGGDGLARGYLGRPDLTAERFVPDPTAGLGGEPGARVYRTGDLVRALPDGRFLFLGRMDQQVKIRGFRIEPGEVEIALAAHPAVAAAAVVAQPGPSGLAADLRLLACVVPRPGETMVSGELREDLRDFLRGRLPEPMIPAGWVFLDAFPLTANGKVDRRALARLRPAAERRGGSAPRTPVEEELARIWEELPGVSGVGTEDDFFALGGDSLQAMQVLSRVRRTFGVELRARDLFEASTVAGLAARIAGAGLAVSMASAPARSSGPIPLSYSQQRLWFLDRFTPGSPVYNLPFRMGIEGDLAPAALAGALGEIVRRHAVLRTTYAEGTEGPRQVIHPASPAGAFALPVLPVIDLTGLPEELGAAQSRRLGREDALRPFDLEAGPVLRAALLRLGGREHRLLLDVHHIAFDGWSTDILLQELADLYGAFVDGRPSPLPELGWQYADFAVWQRGQLTGEALEEQLGFWRRALEGAPGVLELPADHPRPAMQSFRGATLESRLAEDGEGGGAALKRLGREQGATLFMLLLAGLDALLGRATGQTDLLVGSPVAGRGRGEVEKLIGFFVNTLALRADLSGDPSFLTLLARTRETALRAYARADLPFELLVEELRPERDLSRSPLLQVMLAVEGSVQPVPQPAPASGRGTPPRFLPLELEISAAKFDLTLFVREPGAGLLLIFEFATDLFERATIERMAGHLASLLAAAVADPRRRLSELPLLTAAERAQILVEWNDTAVSPQPAGAAGLHRLFEAQAARAPGATALIGPDGGRLTYRELDARAGSLAAHLRALGVGPEILVGVLLERSIDLIVALLAVLKSGGAYVPIDPAYPAPRVAFLLENSGAAVLITRRGLLERFAESLPSVRKQAAVPVFLEEDLTPARERGATTRKAGSSFPEALAYIIYTSGSTGAPKGVALEHRSAVALVLWALEVFAPAELAAVFAGTSVCFDLSIFEIFVPLACGGAVVVGENALALPFHPAAAAVTLINTVPSAIAELVRSGGVPAAVRTVNLAGEALKGSLVRSIYERTGAARVYNLYGPSEDTTYSTFALIPRSSRKTESPSIGRPIAGGQAYVLDRGLSPVPIGVPGEVYLGGAGLARGYLGRPDLTAERFIPDPHGEPGGRLYRTGDLARYRLNGLDGELEFLGRIDHQVKVRGFRIELGEIEAALAAQPSVRESAVLALPEADGEASRLVAFVVPAVEDAPEKSLAAELRAALRKMLPEPLVPALFVVVPRLPLTPNGKLDRRALAALAAQPQGALPALPERAAPEPRTALEAELGGIWTQALGIPQVGLDESFFDLGGHSLLAMRVVLEIRRKFGVELSVRALFEAPTVARLAARIADTQPAAPAEARPRPEGGLIPLSHSQQQLWFLDRFFPGAHTFNIPLRWRIEGALDPAALAGALAGVAGRHSVLRTTYTQDTEQPRQIVHPATHEIEMPIPLPCIDLAGLPAGLRDAAARRLLAADAVQPFDLETGPVLRARLVRLGELEHLFLFTVHHIAFDGWSTDILMRELAALYSASGLPSLPWQYADFAAWQRDHLPAEVLAEQLDFWRRALRGVPEVLELPADHPRPPVQSFRGATLSAALPAGLTAALRDLGRASGATLFMTLLAGFQAYLQRVTGRDDLLVGSPIAGRDRPEVEGLIGFFVNTLALRADLSGDPGFGELLGRTREVCLAAFAHQAVPFEALVEALRPQRDLSRWPLIQVMLAVEGPAPVASPPGLRFVFLEPELPVAKLDLILYAREREEEIVLAFEYATDLFAQPAIARMAGHLVSLLSAAVADPGRRLSELSLLSAAERAQILVEWNDTGDTAGTVPADPGTSLHQLFEAQAARTPGATAVIGPGGPDKESLTYRELNERAEALARHLRKMGVGPEVLAGVLLDRSAELVVALLAVLKSGGAYVPIDPAYPAPRVSFLLENSGAAVLVTRRGLLERFGESVPAAVVPVFLEEISPPSPLGSLIPSALPGGETLAYVIYTSGSTGTPKGVALEHRSAVALVRWALAVSPPEDLAAVFAGTSVCFDLSVFEIFVPLACGGTVVVGESGLALPFHPAAAQVTLVNTVPSVMAELVRSGGVPRSVRTVNLAGEALKGSLVRSIYESTAAARVYNLYGPSEDTTYSTFARMPRRVESPAIGRPITGGRAYVLDRRLSPVPLGVSGEVCLGGAGLARGYLGRPDLTAERFVPDPHGAPGGRLYRTGDLARLRGDGELEFLGRLDHQVKIRGFRIELGEIEAALMRQPGVRECAVLAISDRLVAFVVPSAAGAELRAALREELPEPLVPALFVPLSSLPLTPNGKLDRSALAATLAGREAAAAPDESGALLLTSLEKELSLIWAEALGLPAVGAGQSFFDLGGHSLIAMRVILEIGRKLGVEVSVQALFEAPTVARMAAWIESRIDSRIDSRIFGQAPAAAAEIPREGPIPLSYAQSRLWFLDQLDPGSTAYNMVFPLRIEGPLGADVLAAALREIVRRHAVLRTVYVDDGRGSPCQRAGEVPERILARIDLSSLPAAARAAETARWIDEAGSRPFDLAHGPVLRIALLRLGGAEHVLLLALHHIAADGWSLGILLRELAVLHEAAAAGRPSPLPEPPLQYADFAIRQHRELAAGALAGQLATWRQRLAGAPTVLDLPADHPRPAVQSFRGGLRTVSWPEPPELRGLIRGEAVTPFMLLLAAFGALLQRLTGRDDLLLGTPAANRHRPDTAGLIGFFINMLPFRIEMQGDPPFLDLLRGTRRVALEAYANQDLPFDLLVEELHPQRDLSRSPVIQVLLEAGPAGRGLPSPPGLRLTLLDAAFRLAKLDLSVNVETAEEDGGELAVTADFALDLFEPTTIERLLGHFRQLLAGAVAAPAARLSELPLLTAAERHQLDTEWSGAGEDFPALPRMIERIAAAAARWPDRAAVVAREETLTYGDLLRRAEDLARRLRAHGVGPESRVGIFAERTPELFAAVLAVQLAGGAYVPLDPAYPRERLAFMLADARPALVLVPPHLADRLPVSGVPILSLEEEVSSPLGGGGLEQGGGQEGGDSNGHKLPMSSGVPEVSAPLLTSPLSQPPPAQGGGTSMPSEWAPIEAASAAYVLYTSGSTGRPKGVVVSQGSLSAACQAWERLWEPGAPPRVTLQAASFSFDVFAGETFRTLASGGTLVVCPPDLLGDPAGLLRFLRRWGIESADLVPAVLRLLMDHLDAAGGRLDFLRLLIVGSDAWRVDEHARARRLCGPGIRLLNAYGVTEATIDTTFFESIGRPAGFGAVPIGRPFAGSRVHVVDRRGRLVPTGVAGELVIGGGGVARGYLGRPDLTAERFVPDTFGPPGGRLYRTGDLARRLADGNLQFLGRTDQQIKIRGFRIEPAEVEAALVRQAGVRAAVVTVREDVPGDRRLVAYVVSALPGTDPGALRRALSGELPEHMIPAAVVLLRELPLTPNGKIDLQALPRPALDGAEEAAAPPHGPVEEIVAAIWCKVLGRERVGRDESFFDLGGHSLVAAQLVSRLREAFGVDLPLRELFHQPTVAGLGGRLSALLREPGDGADPGLEARRRAGAVPLSFAQSRLWFLDQLAPGLAAYNIPCPLRLAGPLAPALLAAALSALVRRHGALRTTFIAEAGAPFQVVGPAAPVPLPVIDLSRLGEAERAAAAGRLLAEESRRPFDLAAGPLLRTALLRLSPEEHWLLLTVHHIVADGWSMKILMRELAALYAAAAAPGSPSPLPELPMQYADFAAWQRSRLAGEALASQLASQLDYWRRQLAGAPTSLDLLTDHPRPAQQTYAGAGVARRLPPAVTAGLRALCRSERTTLFIVALAALDALLYRYTGQEDLLVGCASAGRNREEVEGLIGLFVNTLVLRADLRGNPPLRALLRQARETTLAAQAHPDLPFEILVEALRPERDLSRSPFFQVLLNLQIATAPVALAAGLTAEPLAAETGTAKLDLNLALVDAGETLELELEYATDLFEKPSMLRLLDHFSRLLAAAVEQTDLPLADLPLLGEAEAAQLLIGWNDTAPPPASATRLHDLFAAQAVRTPGAVALIGPDGGRLTYRQLAGRAAVLATRLRGLGAGPEVLVGVLLDRTAELVVALFAVLEAGAAYVPIDPAYPRRRVGFLLENSRAAVVVTRRALLADLAASLPEGARALFVEDFTPDPSPIVLPHPGRGAPQGGEANLAYVIYTSGSTGTPKGVALEHRSAVARVRWALEVFPPEDLAGVFAATSVCFDLSVFEIFVPLACGGTVVLGENALALPSHPAAAEVTLVNTVPSAMAELVRSGGVPAGVRTVNLAGEPLPGALARSVYERTPAERVYNLYGPSEDTTYSTFALVARGVGDAGGTGDAPTIGRPVTGSRAYVLDSALRPVPIGVAGEIWLGGDGLARGYLGRPDLTAERFLPDPHPPGGAPGSRLYRTGDLARFRPDGTIELLGRADGQLKVRGFRIEPGEIEDALARLATVQESAVLSLAAPGGEGGRRLVSFVVPAAGGAGETIEEPREDRDLAAALRAALGAVLPQPLVPESFVFLPALPLTPNGKLDRRALERALPRADAARPAARGLPRTQVEEALAEIWRGIFGRPVGIEDNFFDLGGHSLLAVRVVSQIRAAFHVTLPLNRLFSAPTIAGLAAAVEAALAGRRGVALPAIVPVPRSGDLPLSFSQQRLWLLDQIDPGQAVFNLPFPLRLTGPLSCAALERALAEIVRRHESLRTVFGERQGHGFQSVLPAASSALPLADLAGLPAGAGEDEARRLADRDAALPFDLTGGPAGKPLLRTALVRLAAAEHVLLITLHHIVTDGLSTAIFVRELQILYAAFAAGRPSPLPDLALQYPDFAVWQRRALDGGALAALLDRFKERFGTDLPTLRLPADKPRPPVRTTAGTVLSVRLPQDLADAVRRFAQRSGATLFMALLAAFQGLLARITGQERIVVGTPVAGRDRAELEGLIGFFVNTVVLPADTAGDPAFAELLGRVRDMALAAYACQDLPFEKLVEALQPRRDQSRSPLFQVMFALHSEPPRKREEAGALAVDFFPVGGRTSQFDLTLYMADMPDGLWATIEYNTDLFEAPTIERMLAHYQALLAAAVAAPETRLSALPPAQEELLRPAAAEPAAAAVAEASVADASVADARRDRLAARTSKLTPEQREMMERRLRGGR